MSSLRNTSTALFDGQARRSSSRVSWHQRAVCHCRNARHRPAAKTRMKGRHWHLYDLIPGVGRRRDAISPNVRRPVINRTLRDQRPQQLATSPLAVIGNNPQALGLRDIRAPQEPPPTPDAAGC
jgi:hypothetical protein